MALTWGDLNGKIQDKIIPTVADVVNTGDPVRRRTVEKFSLIKLNPARGTDCKQAMSRAAVETEREKDSMSSCDSPSCSECEAAEVGRNDRPSGATRSNNASYKSSPVFIRIRTQNGQQFDGGIKIRQNIGYAELNGAPFGRGQTFNTDYVPTDTAFQVDPKFYYVNITLYGTDDVLARGPQQAVPFVGSKIANAAGKMAKLIATDMYLDGLGTGSSTLSIDGFNQWFDNGSLFTTCGGLTRSDLGVSNGMLLPL